MKFQPDLEASNRVAADFMQFRAGMAAAQAMTPTAQAARSIERQDRQVDALAGLLGQLVTDEEWQFWRKGSFYRPGVLASEPPL